MYTLLKSKVGPHPDPVFPAGIDLRAEARKASRRLYPVTAIYSIYLVILLTLALRSPHPGIALGFVALGVMAWIPTEYLVHRYILHGVFPDGRGWLARALHYLFDAAHADHHARPWDGMYINGHCDTLWAAAVLVPLSFLAPYYTAPVLMATLLACFVAEEWTHHAVHFYNFNWKYFQYLRRRHFYHHSRHGVGLGYGITSGTWDTVAGTRLGPEVRQRLSTGARHARRATPYSAEDLRIYES